MDGTGVIPSTMPRLCVRIMFDCEVLSVDIRLPHYALAAYRASLAELARRPRGQLVPRGGGTGSCSFAILNCCKSPSRARVTLEYRSSVRVHKKCDGCPGQTRPDTSSSIVILARQDRVFFLVYRGISIGRCRQH